MTLLLSTTSIISLRDEDTEGQRGEVIFLRSHSGEGVEAGAESWLTLWGAFRRWEGWCAGLRTGGRSTVALALLCDPDSEHPAGSVGNEGGAEGEAVWSVERWAWRRSKGWWGWAVTWAGTRGWGRPRSGERWSGRSNAPARSVLGAVAGLAWS